MIKLGEKVRCKITGFTGIATAKVEYLNGCIQYCIQPRMKPKDNEKPKTTYIDVDQLEIVGAGKKVKAKKTGGVMPDTPGGSYRG